MDLISSLSTDVVNKALDGLSKRHLALASNLANVETPGYHRRDVHFEAQLKQAIQGQSAQGNDAPLPLQATAPGHFGAPPGFFGSVADVQPEVVEAEDLHYRMDENSVDVESEMVKLSKNTEHYVALSNLQGRMLRSIKSVISNSGGG